MSVYPDWLAEMMGWYAAAFCVLWFAIGVAMFVRYGGREDDDA